MNPEIFVFEDEIANQRLINLVLQAGGYRSQLFANPLLGLQELRRGARPRLILLDIMMPEMDGLHVLKELKADPNLKNLPVVLLTALAQQKVVLQGIKMGAMDYIRKPFHPQQMLERLEKLLPT